MRKIEVLSASSAVGVVIGVALMLLALSLQSLWQDDDTVNKDEQGTSDFDAVETMEEGTISGMDTIEERAGYSIGINIGMNLVGQGVAEDIDNDAVIMGITDAFQGDEFQLAEEEINAALQEFTLIQEAKARAAAAQEVEASQSFLIENAVKEGVITTNSGLQYLVLSEGPADGATPTVSDTVNVHYHGTLTNGTVFDSSVDRGEPIAFPVNAVIPGWTEGLQLMSVGDKFQFVIPSDLAYGAGGAGAAIGPNATLVFEVELLEIE